MNNSILRGFYLNESQREAVRAFMIETLGGIAIQRSFDGEDVRGIKDARELVEKTFDKLEELYSEKKPEVVYNSK